MKPSNLSIQLRDGITLSADLYLNVINKKMPVLLMRTAYGKEIASTLVYAHPIWYMDQGFHVVIQDVRGTGDSDGYFEPVINEANDGYDTIEFIANQTWCDGKVIMYGFSYQGLVQYAAASQRPPHLFAICPAMSGTDFKNHFIFRHDVLKLYDSLLWGLQLDSIRAKKSGNIDLYNIIYNITRSFTISDFRLHNLDWLRQVNQNSLFLEWIDHRHDHDYWNSRAIDIHNITVPVLSITGWFDCYTEGTIYSAYKIYNSYDLNQQLIIGSWSHSNWHNRISNNNFSDKHDLNIDNHQIKWISKLLNKDKPDRNLQILYHRINGSWSSSYNEKVYDLNLWPVQSSASSQSCGVLSEKKQLAIGSDFFVHDPWRPTPSSVRGIGWPGITSNRNIIDQRSDVLVYDTLPLDRDLIVFGKPSVHLSFTTSLKIVDIHCCLSSVSGEVIPFSSGCIRSNSNHDILMIDLDFISILLIKSTKIRLSISCAAFPLYELNSSEDLFIESSTPSDYKTITTKLIFGSFTFVSLPIVDSQK